MDPRAGRAGERLRARIDVGELGSRERRDGGRPCGGDDAAYALEVSGGRNREARLDHVDAEPLELLGDLRLLMRVQGNAGRLLAVSKRGVEDRDPAV